MRREIGVGRALANAAFALAVLGVAGYGVVKVAERHWQWQETFQVRAAFPTIAGLEDGAQVLVQGIDAGVVEAIVPPTSPGGPVTLVLRIDERLRPLVRSDAVVRIAAQGVVGAKVVEIRPGAADAPPLADGQALRAEPPRELADLMEDASETLERLDAVAVTAEQGLGEITAIATAIRRGEGTLGKLVRDDEAYDQLVALSEHGQEALKSLEENLSAVKGIWPISRYFTRRGFSDADRVLYRPGAEREARVLPSVELFEPGRATLTRQGRERLDEVARWFKGLNRPRTTEIVVAAYTDGAHTNDEEMAQVLTQEQAEAVRDYLMERHKIHSNGWLHAARTVAAVGFGTQAPDVPGNEAPSGPSDRVEIVLFTPQA